MPQQKNTQVRYLRLTRHARRGGDGALGAVALMGIRSNASPGFCFRTPTHFVHHGHGGDCDGGALGAFSLGERAARSWKDASRACKKMCLGCARCRFVSFSLFYKECDWFRHCRLDRLDEQTATERPDHLPANKSLWSTMQVKAPPFPDAYMREPGTAINLRTFSVVPWPEEQKKPERPLWVVDDWAFYWIVSESNGEALVMTAIRRAASACVDGNQLMLDIGANTGTYGLVAGALGCTVIAFEPQSHCRKRMRAALHHNRAFSHLVRIVPRPVGRTVGAKLWTPERGCQSAAPSVPSSSLGRPPRRGLVAVSTTSVQRELRSGVEDVAQIAIVKIDAEGAELDVLASLRSLWSRIDNIVVETWPFKWTAMGNTTVEEGANLYAELFEEPAGFRGAFTSDGYRISSPLEMHKYIMSIGRRYFSQRDIWIARSARALPSQPRRRERIDNLRAARAARSGVEGGSAGSVF